MGRCYGTLFKKKYQAFDFNFRTQHQSTRCFGLTDLRFIGKYENIVFLYSNVVSKNRINTYFIKCHHLKENLRKAKNLRTA